MALSFFGDKSHPPTDKDLARCLGPALVFWRRIQKAVASKVPGILAEWGYTSRGTGWGLRLKSGTRVILYMTPGEGQFLASIVLGERSISTARRLPVEVRRLLDAANRYAEGRGVRLRVWRASDVEIVARLVSLKLST